MKLLGVHLVGMNVSLEQVCALNRPLRAVIGASDYDIIVLIASFKFDNPEIDLFTS